MARFGGTRRMSNIKFVLLLFASGAPAWTLRFLIAFSLSGITRDPRFIFHISCPDLEIRYFFPWFLKMIKGRSLTVIGLATE